MSVNRPIPPRRPGSGSGSVPGRGVPPQQRPQRAAPPPPPPPPQAYHPSYADQDDEPPPGPGVPPQLILAASIVGVLLIAALITGIRSGGRTVKLEDLEDQKYEDASDAFASKGSKAGSASKGGNGNTGAGGTGAGSNASAAPTAVGNEAQEIKSVQASLDRYTKALAEEDYDAAVDFIDFDRMLKEIQAAGLLTSISRRDEARFAPALREQIKENLEHAATGQGLSFAKLEVKKIRPLGDRSEVIAYVVATGDSGFLGGQRLKQRWWLKKRGNQWRFFDTENLENGIRNSIFFGVVVEAAKPDNVQPWVHKLGEFNEAAAFAMIGEPDLAEEAVREVESVTLPKQVQVPFLGIKARLALLKEKPDDALKLLDDAQALGGDLPFIHRQRAFAYNQKGDYQKGLAAAKKFIDVLGDDAQAWYAAGEAFEGMGQPAEALAAYRKGHDDIPSYEDNLIGIARLTTPAQKKDLGTRFLRTLKEKFDKGELFATIAVEIENGEVLEELLAAYRQSGGKGYGVNFHAARAKLLKKEYEAAHQILKPLVAKAPEEDKEEVLKLVVDAASGSGQWAEAYPTMPDAKDGMRRIGDILADQGKAADLKKLVEMHKARQPDDEQIPYYLGRALMIEKAYDAAGDQFAAALKLAKSNEQRQQFGAALVGVRYKTGKALAAYTEAPHQDKPAVFDQLAELMAADRDAAGLAKLIDAHTTAVGMTPAVNWAQARIHWIKNEQGPLADALIASRDPILNEKRERTDALRDMLIRALVRHKRVDDARRELKKFGDPPHPLYAVMIEVSAKEPTAARKAVADYLAAGSPDTALWTLYNDPDVGPALQAPELFSLRVKYPQPTSRPATGPATKPAGG